MWPVIADSSLPAQAGATSTARDSSSRGHFPLRYREMRKEKLQVRGAGELGVL